MAFLPLFILCFVFFLSPDVGEGGNIVSSSGNACGKLDTEGVSTFTIQVEAPSLSVSSPIDMILIQFDSRRKLPISSTIFMDKLNQEKSVQRVEEPFRPLPCEALPVTTRQQNCSTGFSMTPEQKEKAKPRYTWDRGHLTPVNPLRFSQDAMHKSYYCVNIAPQDSYTNQNPWKWVELRSESKLKATDGGFVQTGLCSADNMVDGPLTYRGWRIPECFWKLICYRDVKGIVQVVGFIGENTIVGNGNREEDKLEQSARDNQTLTPTSQQEILKRVTRPKLVAAAWETAAKQLLVHRNAPKGKIQLGSECARTISLPREVADEWTLWMTKN